MTAVNSLQPPVASGPEPRAYEPSMEEILASIRRIIADDQSLPTRVAPREPEPEPEPASPEPREIAPQQPASPAPIHVIHAVEKEEEAPPAAPPSHAAEMEALSEALRPMAHGPISAPQFASPVGTDAKEPEAETDHREPEPELRAHPAERLRAADFEAFAREAAASIEPEPYAEPLPKAVAPEPRAVETHVEDEPPVEAPAALFSNATDHSVTAAFNTLAATRLADNSDELLGLARDMIRPLLKTWLDENLPSMVERMVRAEIERVARGGR